MKFREIIRILLANGFSLHRQEGSHRQYRATIDGYTYQVTVACHRESDDIRPKTLASMIRQSGLLKNLFR